MKCSICQQDLDSALLPLTSHPNCVFTELDDVSDPAAQQIKSDMIEIIKWADKQNPRSKQELLGPSELGTPCDRRLGYRIAEMPTVNIDTDPWAAVIGTAMHSWLDDAVKLYCQSHQDCGWLTETPVMLDDFAKGRSDLYNQHTQTVIDHKGAGPSVMKKVRRNGPPHGYVIQLQLYGLGYEKLGYQVKKVALVFYPRAGWLKDVYVWVDDYKPDIAHAAMARMYEVSSKLMELDIVNNPHRWEQLDHYTSDDCGFCPWYDPGRNKEKGATETGCPGH